VNLPLTIEFDLHSVKKNQRAKYPR